MSRYTNGVHSGSVRKQIGLVSEAGILLKKYLQSKKLTQKEYAWRAQLSGFVNKVQGLLSFTEEDIEKIRIQSENDFLEFDLFSQKAREERELGKTKRQLARQIHNKQYSLLYPDLVGVRDHKDNRIQTLGQALFVFRQCLNLSSREANKLLHPSYSKFEKPDNNIMIQERHLFQIFNRSSSYMYGRELGEWKGKLLSFIPRKVVGTLPTREHYQEYFSVGRPR